jgi:RimJ/RimL family protein N-acetyltransferase
MSNADAQHDWTVTLDRSPIHVRQLEADDYDAIVLLSMSLSNHERYLRFFTTHPNYLAEWAQSLAATSDRDQYAIGAFEDDMLVGIANYVARDRSGRAEVSVVVAHEQNDRGLATTMLQILGRIARDNGIHHLTGDVLAENESMRKVITDAGWPCTHHREGRVMHFDVDLDEVRRPRPTDQLRGRTVAHNDRLHRDAVPEVVRCPR